MELPDLSEQKPEQKQTDWRQFFGKKGTDDRIASVQKLITVDKDLFGKTRIPNVFAMAVMGLLGAWSVPGDSFTVNFGVGDKNLSMTFPKTVFGLSNYFDIRYRIDAMSYLGLSREEYTTALMSLFLQAQAEQVESAKDKIEKEGSHKK